MNIRRLVWAGLVVALALAGCGSGSGSSSHTSSGASSPSTTAGSSTVGAGPGSSSDAAGATTSSNTSAAAGTSSSASGSATTDTTSTSAATATPAAFKASFAVVQKQFRRLGSTLGYDVLHAGKKSDAQITAEFGALAAGALAQSQHLAALGTPAAYRPEIATLVSGFDGVARDLAKISEAGIDHSATAAETATRRLLLDAAKIKQADNAISKSLGLPLSPS
ncbi:MAG: hypothetical protein ABSH51_25105 [Solirubrobacteraceae bacterium]